MLLFISFLAISVPNRLLVFSKKADNLLPPRPRVASATRGYKTLELVQKFQLNKEKNKSLPRALDHEDLVVEV